MDQERWRSIEALFHAALECGPGARQSFLDKTCAGDTDMRRQVELLLSQNEEAGNFPKTPAWTRKSSTAAQPCPGFITPIPESGPSPTLTMRLPAGDPLLRTP